LKNNCDSQKPIPQPNLYINTRSFWEAAKQGKLILQFCPETGNYQHYPRPVSIFTGKRNIEWREVSGKGNIYSFTIVRSSLPGCENRSPYVIAIVELEEGVRILCNIHNCDPERVKIGTPVKLYWERLSGDINYPAFEPDKCFKK